jgi:hypothetical protein
MENANFAGRKAASSGGVCTSTYERNEKPLHSWQWQAVRSPFCDVTLALANKWRGAGAGGAAARKRRRPPLRLRPLRPLRTEKQPRRGTSARRPPQDKLRKRAPRSPDRSPVGEQGRRSTGSTA